MKKRYLQLIFLLFLIVGTVLIIRQQQNTPYQKDNGFVFGTVYNITYQNDKNLKQEIETELKKVDMALSMFNEKSVISKVNQGSTSIPQTEEGRMFEEVVSLALNISKETEGAFDITVAPLVNAWGFGFKQGFTPTPQQIDSLRLLIGYKKIYLDKKKHYIATNLGKTMTMAQLDCSAIAKGYGSDVVARLLRAKGIKNFISLLINFILIFFFFKFLFGIIYNIIKISAKNTSNKLHKRVFTKFLKFFFCIFHIYIFIKCHFHI